MEQDKRVIKTKKAISEAFLTLLRRKSIDHVTVNDICAAACISRNTFYAYYVDKYKLIEVISDQFVQRLCEETLNRNVFVGYQPPVSEYQSSINKSAQTFFDYLDKNREMVTLLSKNNPSFWNIFTAGLFDFMLAFSANQDERTKVYATYSVHAVTGCFKEYFEGRLPMKATDFVRYLTEVAEAANRFMIKQDAS